MDWMRTSPFGRLGVCVADPCAYESARHIPDEARMNTRPTPEISGLRVSRTMKWFSSDDRE